MWVPRLYGIVVTGGIVVGMIVVGRVARKLKLKADVWDLLTWLVIPGIVGARLYHVVDLWEEVYVHNLLLIPQVWTGGLAIYGAIAGAGVGLWWWCRRQKENFKVWLDLVAIGAPVAQAIGRWGNYFNQELYGKPTTLPWGIYIDREGGYYHPLFLYESLWNGAIFGVLYWFWRKKGWKVKQGTIFTLYILFYAIGRFILEGLRVEQWWVNRVISGLIIVGALWKGF